MDFPGGIQGQKEASGDKRVGCDIKMPFQKNVKMKNVFCFSLRCSCQMKKIARMWLFDLIADEFKN